MKKWFILISCVLFLSFCCKRRAENGIVITVLDDDTHNPIGDIQVHIRDIQNHNSESLVDYGNTNNDGQVKLKLSKKCSDYLEIQSGGNDKYYSGDYNGSTHTTKTLPNSITIYLKHK
jgi:5-hydroxyisourate hydrolase-like protein (transthyretin family)